MKLTSETVHAQLQATVNPRARRPEWEMWGVHLGFWVGDVLLRVGLHARERADTQSILLSTQERERRTCTEREREVRTQ